jgi:riboflavin kinase / FMN adenylyltransferase
VRNQSQNGCSVWVASSTESALTPTAVALGKFDGVHLGHQRVIRPVLQPASSEGKFGEKEIGKWEETQIALTQPHNLTTQSQGHIYSTVVTFDPHPQAFFTGQPRTLLTPLDEKVQQLRSLGVEQLVLLPFDGELAALTPKEFVEQILVRQLRAARISVGEDFCFGKKRSGTARDLQLLAAQYNIPVTVVTIQTDKANQEQNNINGVSVALTQEARISTSLIRQVLESGDIKHANQLLGRPYTLIGTVIVGQQLGRTIGFPTANLQLPIDKFLPRYGVYAVRVFAVPNNQADFTPLCMGVMNIGNRPTVNGNNSTTTEVHLLDWSGDLYGQKLAVQLIDFLRPEQKFPSLGDLKTQIQLDCSVARGLRVRG